MRGVLFRGKRIDNGEWVEGSLLDYRPHYDWTAIYRLWDNDDGMLEMSRHDVHSSTVGQYTGLKDKNGKRIFEGDIVAQNWYDYNAPLDDSFGEVVFCEYNCSFSVMDIENGGIVPLGNCHAYHWEAEVIGNIHDNPELLEVGE